MFLVVKVIGPSLGGLLAVLLAAASGCSAGCQNIAYDVDTSQPGAQTPIEAIVEWGQTGSHDFPQPPQDGWEETQSSGSSRTLTNPEDGGWVVDVTETDPGGWVVTSATRNC
jgi:hypothetical protein